MTVAIIDYGSGNLRSAAKAFERMVRESGRSDDIVVTADADVVRQADHVVLPGVGAFANCRRGLSAVKGMEEALQEVVIEKGQPFLGICVGMQLMATVGREHGDHAGLDWIKGEIVPLSPDDASMKVPHMGWNDLQVKPGAKLFSRFEPQPRFYFLHSYFFDCEDKANVAATASYGLEFACVVSKRHIHGMQCHPEKSHHFGVQLLKNFAEL